MLGRAIHGVSVHTHVLDNECVCLWVLENSEACSVAWRHAIVSRPTLCSPRPGYGQALGYTCTTAPCWVHTHWTVACDAVACLALGLGLTIIRWPQPGPAGSPAYRLGICYLTLCTELHTLCPSLLSPPQVLSLAIGLPCCKTVINHPRNFKTWGSDQQMEGLLLDLWLFMGLSCYAYMAMGKFAFCAPEMSIQV